MATYFFRNTGNTNYTTASNWSLTSGGGATGVVPLSTDSAVFNANSGNCTMSSGTALGPQTVTSLICTGYTGTFSINGHFGVSSSVILASGMTISADTTARTFRLGAVTITTNGVYIPLNITTTSGPTVTLVDDIECLNVGINNGASNFFGTFVSSNTTTKYIKVRGSIYMTSPINTSATNTVNLRMIGTGTFGNPGAYSFSLPFEISTSGTVTFNSGSTYPFGNSGNNYPIGFEVISGNTITTGSIITFNSNGTVSYKVDSNSSILDTVNVNGIIELQSTLSATTIQTSTNTSGIVHIFSGTSGFVCDNFALNAVGVNTYRSVSLTPGNNYRVNKLITTPSIPIGTSTLASTSGTLLATITLNGGSNLIRNTMTRIDASGGVFINNIGTITNCKNVGTSTMNILI